MFPQWHATYAGLCRIRRRFFAVVARSAQRCRVHAQSPAFSIGASEKQIACDLQSGRLSLGQDFERRRIRSTLRQPVQFMRGNLLEAEQGRRAINGRLRDDIGRMQQHRTITGWVHEDQLVAHARQRSAYVMCNAAEIRQR